MLAPAGKPLLSAALVAPLATAAGRPAAQAEPANRPPWSLVAPWEEELSPYQPLLPALGPLPPSAAPTDMPS